MTRMANAILSAVTALRHRRVRKKRLPAGLAAGLCILLPMTVVAEADEVALGARLDAHAEGFMLREQVPGAIAAIVAGDEVVLRAYGWADIDEGRRAGPDNTGFEIGSVSKLFTWIAVMMLVEEGALDLRADISGYLPDFEVPGHEPLTMAHLMSHRSGFEESYAIFDPAIAALPRAEALAASAPEQIFPRGAVTSYSNWGVALAGLVVEEVSGQTWEDFVQARILAPLGMEDTTLGEGLRRPDQPPLSQSYQVQAGVARPAFRIDIGAFAPAGSIAGTAADMARFLRFLVSDGAVYGARLLQPETMARMRTRLFDDRPDAPDMAHGFQSRPRYGTMVYGHGGGLNEFHSNLVFIPEIGAGVFISQNGGTGVSLPFIAPDLILAELAAEAGLAPPDPQAVPDAAARAQEVAGRYLNNRRTFTGWAQFFGALSPLDIVATSDGALMIQTNILPVPSRFEPIGPDLWQDAQGNRVRVVRDAGGDILRIADGTGAHSHERARGLTDPNWLTVAFGLAVLLAVTTLLGFVWRRGLKGGTPGGRLAAGTALVSAASVLLFAGAGIAAALAATQLGSTYIFDQPQPTLQAILVLADVVAVVAVALLLSLVAVWRVDGWNLWRRLHQTGFALSLAGFAGLLLYWGLAFGGPI
jgi:CubicO group peptidase (beta-lactamase class C family)